MATADVCCFMPASIHRVFELLTDHANYDQLASVGLSKLLAEGRHERNGQGAVRDLTVSGTRFIEDITNFDSPYLMEYRVVECYFSFGNNRLLLRFPLIHQEGRIELVEKDGGTQVRWLSRFSVDIPFGDQLAKLMRPGVERVFNNILQDMKRLLAHQYPCDR